MSLICLTGWPARVNAQISPNTSVNLDASRDGASKSGFLLDTNRKRPMLFIVGDSTVHNPGRVEKRWGDVIGKYFDSEVVEGLRTLDCPLKDDLRVVPAAK